MPQSSRCRAAGPNHRGWPRSRASAPSRERWEYRPSSRRWSTLFKTMNWVALFILRSISVRSGAGAGARADEDGQKRPIIILNHATIFLAGPGKEDFLPALNVFRWRGEPEAWPPSRKKMGLDRHLARARRRRQQAVLDRARSAEAVLALEENVGGASRGLKVYANKAWPRRAEGAMHLISHQILFICAIPHGRAGSVIDTTG